MRQPQRAGTPVTLDPADFWELRARSADIDVAEHELLKQRLAAQQRLATAKAAARAVVDRVLAKYGVAAETFSLNDDTLELTPQPAPADAPRTE